MWMTVLLKASKPDLIAKVLASRSQSKIISKDEIETIQSESLKKQRSSIDEHLKTEIDKLPVIACSDSPLIAVSIDNQSAITLNFFKCSLHLNDD